MNNITTADYLNQLLVDKETLVTNLQEKGVPLSGDETFTELAPAVGDIPGVYAPKYVGFYDYPGTVSDLLDDIHSLNTKNLIRAPRIYTPDFDLVDLNLSCWNNNPNMTSTERMFAKDNPNQSSNSTLKGDIDLSGFDMSHITDMSYMFYYCDALNSISMGNCTATNVLLDSTFAICSRLTNLDLGTWKPKVIKNASNQVLRYTFGNINTSGSSPIQSIDVTNFKDCLSELTGVVELVDTFRNTNVSKFIGLELWKASPNATQFNVTDLFYGSKITELDLSGLNPQNCSVSGLCNGCRNLTKAILPNFKFRGNGVTTTMFSSCSSLTYVDLTGWDTSNVSSYQYMFSGCSSLTSLDLSMFTVRTGGTFTSVAQMFHNCTSLQHLDLRNWKFSSIPTSAYPQRMFGSTNNVPTIPLDCEIIVKDDTEKNKLLSYYSTFTNVKTVAEYEAL